MAMFPTSLSNWKTLQRAYQVRSRLGDMSKGLTLDERYWDSALNNIHRCTSSPWDLTCLFFSAQPSWTSGRCILIPCLRYSQRLFFSLPEDYTCYSTVQLQVLAFTSLIASCHLLLNWKATNVPSSTQWINRVMSLLKLDKIRHAVNHCPDRCHASLFETLPSFLYIYIYISFFHSYLLEHVS